jgi:hypothetical protein
MRPVTTTVTGVAAGPVIVVDHYQSPSTMSLGCTIDSGTATYSVQHTYDDPFSPTFTPGSARWFQHPVINAVTANTDSNYAYPPRACRLNVTVSSGGTVTLVVNQAGAI